MDNQATEPSNEPLTTEGAAEVFANLLDPEREARALEVPTELSLETPAAAASDDPMVTVKIDGKDIEMPLSELKNGYQRQADYTRKTQDVAEIRRAATAEQQAANQERQAYAGNLQKMQAQLEGALEQQQNINWQSLIDSDPVEYLKQQHLYQQRQAAYQQNIEQQRQLATVLQAEQVQNYSQHLSAQQQALLAKLPDWKDEGKAAAEKAALRTYLLGQGYDEQAVSSVADARAVVMARKAMLYDQMLAKANTVTKRVSNLPSRTERPGAGVPQGLDKRSSAFQRLSKSGRVEDA
ncbi:MAG: hypothetical protein EBY24_19230, partial [Betaproteobacteria bacterium]|nr:hypothetical protein [Betaproteobacteria bacterium]